MMLVVMRGIVRGEGESVEFLGGDIGRLWGRRRGLLRLGLGHFLLQFIIVVIFIIAKHKDSMLKIANLFYKNIRSPLLQPLYKPSITLPYLFSTKKQNKQKQKKSYNMEIDDKKLPQHLKKAYAARKQTQNLQVPSQSTIQNTKIIEQIVRQRTKIETIPPPAVQPSEEQLEAAAQSTLQATQVESFSAFNYTDKFLRFLLYSNTFLTGFLTLTGKYYWLGFYSASFLPTSLMFTFCAGVGINLGYLIVRQGLCMHTEVSKLREIDVTGAPGAYYGEMGVIGAQILGLAAVLGAPMWMEGLSDGYRMYVLMSLLLPLVSVNIHSHYQQKQFPNPEYKMGTQANCFLVLFLLYCFIVLKIYQEEEKQEKQEDLKKFEEGVIRYRTMWRIKRQEVGKDQKITDILDILDKETPTADGQAVIVKIQRKKQKIF